MTRLPTFTPMTTLAVVISALASCFLTAFLLLSVTDTSWAPTNCAAAPPHSQAHMDEGSKALARQAAFCEDAHPMTRAGVISMAMESLPGKVTMYFYDNMDRVSSSVKSGEGWEYEELREMLWAMDQPPSDGPPSDGSRKKKDKLFVDIGANVGWFTLNMATRGFRVEAFEGMRSNSQLIRSSLCSTPALMGLVTLHATGLGAAPAKCYIFSGIDNQGDGVTDCNSRNEDEAKVKTPEGYVLRGAMLVKRLDSLLDSNVQVLKMDVEGNEPMVMAGAIELFQKRTVEFMLIEFNTVMLRGLWKGHLPIELLRTILKLGFRVSAQSFRGPFVNIEDVPAFADELDKKISSNLFFVNEKRPL